MKTINGLKAFTQIIMVLGIVMSLFTAKEVSAQTSVGGHGYCSIYNPGQIDRANRHCATNYGVVYDGYIVDNSCYNTLDSAYQVMQATRACSMVPPLYSGSCTITNPGVKDSNGRYCDKTYGVLFQGAIANNTCYHKLDAAIDAMQAASYCRGGNVHPTVSLLVNGSKYMRAYPGQTVNYRWNSNGVYRVESYYFANGGDSCEGGFSHDDFIKGNRKPWVAKEVNQIVNLSAQVQQCQRGLTYTIVLVGYGNNGAVAQDQIQVSVP